MHPSLSIGDFARATNLSIKTLRFYHESGILEPVEIDPNSGYRRYSTAQIPTAQVIRRFRDLDMPLEEIRAVLAAPSIETRGELIAAHLRRLQDGIERTQAIVASLQDLLARPDATVAIEHRAFPETTAAAITEVIDTADAPAWYEGALGELYGTLEAHGVRPSSPAGGIFANEIFTVERGQATIFLPCVEPVRTVGRITSLVVPAVELAVTVHSGRHDGIDRAYGALGGYVAGHSLAVDGPLREYYLVNAHDSSDASTWRTAVGWPIFATGSVAQ
jgi:DNA-binding transcriptional MerR regulator